MLETNYSYVIERDEEQLKRNDADFRKWSNPLEVRYETIPSTCIYLPRPFFSLLRLPYAPSMKIYCVYGHGKETERSYWYDFTSYSYDHPSDPELSGTRRAHTSTTTFPRTLRLRHAWRQSPTPAPMRIRH